MEYLSGTYFLVDVGWDEQKCKFDEIQHDSMKTKFREEHIT